MPRRKSTQSSSLKRPSDEDPKQDVPASKQVKTTDASEPVAGAEKQDTLISRVNQDAGGKPLPPRKAKTKTEPGATVVPIPLTEAAGAAGVSAGVGGAAVSTAALGHVGEEMVVLTRTLSPSDTGHAGNGNGGKPNRSLEALFQVTDSELQNMRQEPPTPPSASNSSVSGVTTPTATSTITISPSATNSQSIVVLSNVGPGVISQDGIRFIIAEDTTNVGTTVKPLHHHKAAILQHHHQQQQMQQQQQQHHHQLSPPGVIMATAVHTPAGNILLGDTTAVEKKHPALGNILQNTKMKLVYTKQVHESGSDGSFASTSTSIGSITSMDTSDEGVPSGSLDNGSSSTGQAAGISGAAGRKRKHPQKPGRYVCNFCGRGCAKPSVLQKHLRAHTGERPYPCLPCGFSFKTKSNLYKHRKSLAHAVKVNQIERGQASSSLEDGAERFSLEEGVEVKDVLAGEESGGESERTDSDVDASVEEEEVTVIREETLGAKDRAAMQVIPVIRTSSSNSTLAAGETEVRADSASMAGNHGNSSGASGAPSQQQQVYVYEKPVREEYILENIRQKIDKRKLMEWSRQMDRIKHQEHVDLLQMHSNFPTRIAPKADDGEELSPPAMAQESSPSGITIMVNSDNEETAPVELLPNPASPHPTGVSASLSVPAGGHDDPHLIRQVSAPAALDVSPHSPPAHHQQHDLDPVVLEEQEGFEFLESPGDANQTTKVLRKLEALNEKFPNSEGCTYTFKTLPDNAIQVTIHMAKDAKENSSKKKPKIGTSKSHDDRLYTGEPTLMKTSSVSGRMTGTEVKVTSASVSGGLAPSGQSLGSFSSRLTPRMPPLLSRSVSADTKTFTTEMLKERIQQLISANAAIVDMPMADPPRTKGRFSRQNSDSGFQSWKIGDQGSISAASLEQAGLATSVSTSKITIPNITSIPLQPIPADLEAAGRGTNLLSSVSLDTGRDKPGAHPRDLRRSVSASGVHMMVPPTIVRTFHDTDSKKDSTDLPEEVSVIPTAPSVTRPGLAEGNMAEVSLVTADGSMSIPASLPLEVINAISSASGAAGKGEIKLQFKIGKSVSEQTYSLTPGTTSSPGMEKTLITSASSSGAYPMIGQPGVQYPKVSKTGSDITAHQQKAAQDNSVIKNLLQKGAAVSTPSRLAPPSQLDPSPTGRHPKLKSDAKVKSADAAYSSPQIVKSKLGAQQVVLTVKDIHSKSMDSSFASSHSPDQTKVFTVRDDILGIRTSKASAGTPHSSTEGPSQRDESEKVERDASKKFVCPDCGIAFNQGHLLNMHKMFYCNQSSHAGSTKPTIQIDTVNQDPPSTNRTGLISSSNTLTVPTSLSGTHKLQFHHHSQDELEDRLSVTRKGSNPTFLKSHSTTEVEARAAWQKEDYPQLRSQLTLRPSQSVDESGARAETLAAATKPQQNFIIENIDPLLPPKKGRPKGSKNKPKDLNMILAKASAKASATKAFAGIPPSGLSPSVQKVMSPAVSSAITSAGLPGSPSVSAASGLSPLVMGMKLAPKPILPRSQQYFTPLLTVSQAATSTPPMIGQPMISVQPVDPAVSSSGGGTKGDSTSAAALTSSSSKPFPVFVTQPEMLSSATGFPLGVPSLVSTPQGTALLTPGTPGTPGTPTTDPQSLWKLKLKGRLLMKRSISEQKMATYAEVERKVTARSSPLTASTPASSAPQSTAVPLSKSGVSPVYIFKKSDAAQMSGASSLSTHPQLIPATSQPIVNAGSNEGSSSGGVPTPAGGAKLDKAASATSSDAARSPLLHGPPVLRAMSEPVMKDTAVTNIPKLELLAGVTLATSGSRVSGGNKKDDTVVTGTDASVILPPGLLIPTSEATSVTLQTFPTVSAQVEGGEAILVSGGLHPLMMPVSVPVVLAQPVFVNTQMILSGAYRSAARAHIAAQGGEGGLGSEASNLGSIVITESRLTLPAIPFSSLLNPNLPQQLPLTPTSMVAAPGRMSSFVIGTEHGRHSPSRPYMIVRSPSGSSEKTFPGKNGAHERVGVKDITTPSEIQPRNGKPTAEDKLPRPLSVERENSDTGLKAGRMLSVEDGKELSVPSTPATPTPMRIPLYLYGHSYPTLHASTFVTFCCVKRPQPMYVQVKGSNRRVSMYSDWRLSKHNPNPVGLTSRMLLALYRSRYTANPTFATCAMMQYNVTHSSYWQYQRKMEKHSSITSSQLSPPSSEMSCEDVDMQSALGAKDRRSSTPTSDRSQDASTSSRAGSFDVKLMSPGSGLTKDEVMEILSSKGGPVFRGGYKSEDMYEYIRGRGRGKYVCESCGIRCKKPSMLKKHLRTHTDFRPYHCHHCKFSFKTKGNLTKHMKSKAHQKRCLELGIFPVPVTVEESQIDEDALAKQCAIAKDARILDSELRGRSMLGGASFDGDGDDEDDDEDDQDDDDEDEGQPMEEGEDGRGRYMDRVFRGMSDPGASPPVLMTAKESQRAPLQRSTALASISRELTSTPNLDTEIARSLLDLSRKVEAQGSGEVTAKSLETDEACQNAITRLDSLIGTLMSRTKPLSGLKLGSDNSPIIVRIKETEGDSVDLIISQENQPGKGGTTPVITIDHVSDEESDLKSPLRQRTAAATAAAAAAPATVSSATITTATTSASPSATPTTLASTGPSRPTHLSLLKPPSAGSVTITLSPTATAAKPVPGTAVTMTTGTRLQAGNLPSPSLMKFLPAYMSAHKYPGYTPTNQGPIVGQMIPRAGSAHMAGREGSQGGGSGGGGGSSGGNVPPGSTPLSAQTPQMFQFSGPFLEILHRQNSLQQYGTTPTTTTTTSATTSVATSSFHRSLSSQLSSESELQGTSTAPRKKSEAKSLASSDSDPAYITSQSTTSFKSKNTAAVTSSSARKTGGRNAKTPTSGTLPVMAAGRKSQSSEEGRQNSATESRTASQPVVYVVNIDPSDAKTDSPGGLRYACDICDALFTSQQQALRHRSSHFEQQSPQKALKKCGMCDRTFQSEGQLKRHQMADGHLPSAVMKAPSMNAQRYDEEEEESEGALNPLPKSACPFCSMIYQEQLEFTDDHGRSKMHLNALERLGMLPVGSFDRRRQGAVSSSTTAKGPAVTACHMVKVGTEGLSSVHETIRTSHDSPTKDPLKSVEAGGISGKHVPQTESLHSSKAASSPPKVQRTISSGNVSADGGDAPTRGQKALQFLNMQRDNAEKKRDTEREGLSQAKKPKLQHMVLHSIDSDADGDSHLVIDEDQGESSRNKPSDGHGHALSVPSKQVVSSSSSSEVAAAQSTSTVSSVSSVMTQRTVFVWQKSKESEAVGVKESAGGATTQTKTTTTVQGSASEDKPSSAAVSNGLEKTPSDDVETKEEQSEAPRPVCGLCAENFASVQELKAHLLSHAELRPFVCEYCDAGFTNAQSLRTHLHTHRQECPYICGLCGDTFAQSEDLRVHHASHSKTSIIRHSDAPPASTSPIPSGVLPATSKLPPVRAASVPKPQMSVSSGLMVPSVSSALDSPHRKRARSPGEYRSVSPLPQAKRMTLGVPSVLHEGVPGTGLRRSLSAADSMSDRLERMGDMTATDSSGRLKTALSEQSADSFMYTLKDLQFNPEKRSEYLSTDNLEPDAFLVARRLSHGAKSPFSDSSITSSSAPSSRRPSRGSEGTGRERRPTICRQNEIEIGDQDLLPDVTVEEDDVVFQDKLQNHRGDVGASGLRVGDFGTLGRAVKEKTAVSQVSDGGVNLLVAGDPKGADVASANSETSVYLVKPSESSVAVSLTEVGGDDVHSFDETHAFTDQSGASASTVIPSSNAVQHAGSSLLLQHQRSADIRQQSVSQNSPSFANDQQSLSHHAALLTRQQPHQMLSADPRVDPHHHVTESAEEDMDSEVQSYFTDHTDLDPENISAAILLNDTDSDDPQLLVCEEEMVDSSKDGTPDVDEGVAESGEGSDHTPGEKNTEWDDWGSLSIDMQPTENEGDMGVTQVPGCGDVKDQ